MFNGCTSLTSAPELSATSLDYECYKCMFQDCTSLTSAPELPATNLAEECYSYMFAYCYSLNYVNVGFTNWSSSGTLDWFYKVSSGGTFECPEELVSSGIKYGKSYIPEGWDVETY